MMTTRTLGYWLGLPVALVLAGGALTGTWAQATGDFLCSAGPRDGLACDPDNVDADCAPTGVCVIAQAICNGGLDDGFYCGCIGGACNASTPVCDPDFTGICVGGVNAGLCCDENDDPEFSYVANCDSAPCAGTQRVCLSGDFKGFACVRDEHCDGAPCRSTGTVCFGGDFDYYPCVDDDDCLNVDLSPGGTCEGPEPVATPTVTVTPTRTATGIGTVTPTRTRTPTSSTATPATATPTTSTPGAGTVTPSRTASPQPTATAAPSATVTPPPGGVVYRVDTGSTCAVPSVPPSAAGAWWLLVGPAALLLRRRR